MVADFLPSSVAMIQDRDAIALLQQLERRTVETSFGSIATAYVHHAPTDDNRTPFVLIHGFDSSLLEFRRLFPLLAAERETWAIDLFGSGFTEFLPALSVNPRSIRQHLLSVLDSWIAQPVILVGASLGGAVAIDLALHYPQVVRSLVLIDSVGFSGSFPIGQVLPRLVIEWGADWLYWRKRMALSAALSVPNTNQVLIDALRCSLVHQDMPGWKTAIASFTQSGGYANLSISQIQPPTLILWGTADDVLGIDDAARFQRSVSNSHLVWIENAGHVPHFDQPQSVAESLLKWDAIA